MITVLLDSSNRDLAVGIGRDGKIIDSTSYEAWQRQSESMIPELDKILKKNQIKRTDISDIVVAIGPGSYTGVRFALTIAKVMALALNVPIYPVSSLRAMKIGNKPTIALINARSSRSYIGVFEEERIILEDQIMTNEEVLKYIAKHKEYEISGDVQYLGLEGHEPNALKEMMNLKPIIKPCENSLGLKPIYLKD